MTETTTLCLARQDQDARQWFPAGRLDADGAMPQYRYITGARRGPATATFPTLRAISA